MQKKLSNFILGAWQPHSGAEGKTRRGKFFYEFIFLLGLSFFACKHTSKENKYDEDYHPSNGTVLVKEYFIDNGRRRVWHYYSSEQNKKGTYFNIDTFFVSYDELYKKDKNKYPLEPIVLQCCEEWNFQKMDIYAEGLEKNIVLTRIENSNKLRIKYLGKNIRLKPLQIKELSVGLWETHIKMTP